MFGLVTIKGTSQRVSRPAFRSILAHQQFSPTAGSDLINSDLAVVSQMVICH